MGAVVIAIRELTQAMLNINKSLQEINTTLKMMNRS